MGIVRRYTKPIAAVYSGRCSLTIAVAHGGQCPRTIAVAHGGRCSLTIAVAHGGQCPLTIAAALDHDGFESGSDSKPVRYEAAASAHQTTNSARQRRYLFTRLVGGAR